MSSNTLISGAIIPDASKYYIRNVLSFFFIFKKNYFEMWQMREVADEGVVDDRIT